MKKTIKFIKGMGFALIIFFLYYLICPNIFSLLFYNGLKSNNYWISNISRLFVYLCTFLIVLFIVRKDVINDFKKLKKDPKPILSKGLSYWVYGVIVMIISNLIVSSLVGNIAVNEQTTRDTLLSYPIYAIPTICLIGPFLEELVFRFGFKKAFTRKIPYTLFSALIFGGLHVLTAIDEFTIAGIMNHISEFLFLVPYGSLGFFFAKSYYETDNIFSSIIPHTLHNTISVILIIVESLVL